MDESFDFVLLVSDLYRSLRVPQGTGFVIDLIVVWSVSQRELWAALAFF